MPALRTLRLGLAGAGTVGCGLLHLLQSQRDLVRARTGVDISVTVVAARNPHKERTVDLGAYQIVPDPMMLVSHADVDAVVELMGGSGDPALSLVGNALNHKKPVITANKALLAVNGAELSDLARTHNTLLLFEAAVGGGIPVIKTLREGLVANHITHLAGILNGTCNYILTTMEKTGRGFVDVLHEAQKLGYAEADPSLDVDGGDTAHKLAILQSLATNTPPDLAAISTTGIRDITIDQMRQAASRGFRIKLLGVMDAAGARVAPHLVPHAHALAGVDDAFNAIAYTGDAAGAGMIMGRGAGAHPTASAVLADICDLATGRAAGTFGLGPFNGAPRVTNMDPPHHFDHELGLPIWG